MVKKQLLSSDYATPAIVEIAVRAEAGFAVSLPYGNTLESLEEEEADDAF